MHSYLLSPSLPPLFQFLLINMPQLIDLRCFPSRDSFRKLDKTSHRGTTANRILNSLRIHLDHQNPGVFRPAIVLPIAEVANPGFQCGRVVFLHDGAVSDEAGTPGDGGPFA